MTQLKLSQMEPRGYSLHQEGIEDNSDMIVVHVSQ